MRRIWVVAGLIILLAAQGCLVQPAAQPTPVPAPLTDAPVSGVEVLTLQENPPDVRVLVHGSLPDGCARLGQEEIEQDGRLISVHLPASRAVTAGEACPPGPISYDRVIRLPLDKFQPGKYAVLVNGSLNTFVLAAPQPVVPAAQPQPTQAPEKLAVTGNQPAAVPAAPSTSAPQPLAPASQNNTVSVPATFQIIPLETKSDRISLNPPADPNCNKVALYGDLSVENGTAFDAGETFVKIWRVKNAGSCTWGAGYQLVFVGGYKLGADGSQPLPPAAPGKIVEISVPMAAPQAPGTFESDWAFAGPDGKPFGAGATGSIPLSFSIAVRQKPADTPIQYGCGAVRNADFEQQILTLINARRAEFGLPPHKLLDSISAVARAHSVDMACRNKDTHYSPDGMLYTGRLQMAGIPFANSNEIIFAGDGGPKGAVYWWMEKSPLHRSIILSDKYSYVGIGVVVRKDLAIQEWYTVDFIRPPGE